MNKLATIVLAGLLASSGAQAGVIAFDDAYAALNNGGNPSSYYVASDGMSISGTYFGLVGGNGNGDPGNWNLAGTNGSAFLGCNSGSNCSPTFTFSSLLSALTLDLGMPGFNWSGQFTVNALLNNVVVDSDVVSVSSPSDPGAWATASLAGSFDSVRVSFQSTGGDSFGFGIDNIDYTPGRVIPEPSSLALLALAGCALALSRRRRHGSNDGRTVQKTTHV